MAVLVPLQTAAGIPSRWGELGCRSKGDTICASRGTLPPATPRLYQNLSLGFLARYKDLHSTGQLFQSVQSRRRRPLRNVTRCVMKPPSREFRLSEVSSSDHPPRVDTAAAGGEWRVVPDLWKTLAARHGEMMALVDPHHKPVISMTYQELEEAILDFSEALRLYGVGVRDKVALFSDNSARWLIADQGIMTMGACDAVRGAKAPAEELVYIIKHSESTALIVETPSLLQKLLPAMGDAASAIKFATVLWDEDTDDDSQLEAPFPVYRFSDFIAAGHTSRFANQAASGPGRRAPLRDDDLATIVYTSGTTGFPKGVMLTHANLMHQIHNFRAVIDVQPGDSSLSLLPPWHMYERSAEYYCLSSGVRQVYSNVKRFKEDLQKYPPDYFVAVPLVFDTLYNGVQKKLAAASPTKKKLAQSLVAVSKKYMDARRVWQGLALPALGAEQKSLLPGTVEWVVAGVVALLLYPLHLLAVKLVYSKVRDALGIRKVAISGGGSLAPHVDRFFAAIGLTLVNGYGLTETSPVLCCRRPYRNVLGSVGTPLADTELKVVDPATGKTVPPGTKGQVMARGPQIMKGYFKNAQATAKIIDSEGWFNTEDLGWIAPPSAVPGSRHTAGVLVLEGRSKDTIVLASGENVEPAPVEEAVLQSNVVSQIMLVGQDKRKLGALVVVNEEEARAAALAAQKPGAHDSAEPTKDDLRLLVRREISRCLARFHPHEQVGPFVILDEPFSVESGELTATMKMKRDVILDRNKEKLAGMYKRAE